jgi:hypothetical protein
MPLFLAFSATTALPEKSRPDLLYYRLYYWYTAPGSKVAPPGKARRGDAT